MMMKHKLIGGLAISLAAMTMVGTSAFATDGYFAHGFGARHKALGGAGVADGNDATSGALNPAGLVHLKRDEFSMSVSAFSPRRKYSQTGATRTAPFFSAPGSSATIKSDKNWFAVPNMAYAKRTTGNPFFDVFGFSVVGNGGMNTQYPGSAGGIGVFGKGEAGINLEQAIISVSFAKKIGSLSVGISPAVVRQTFRARGLQGFGVADRGTDVSWGYGLRAGVEWAVTPSMRIGLAGNTKYYMQRFDKYAGLFAERGDFDIPASIQAGIAVDLTPTLTIMADYKRIWYGSVKSISNPSANIFFNGPGNPLNLGPSNGAGFGWKDVDVIKLGVEWNTSNALTLRAGYSYNTSPINSKDVTFNILAPATVQHHITAGAELALNNNWSLELEGMYAPEKTITGPSLFNGAPACAPTGTSICNGTESISMYQFEITAGIKYKW